MKKLVVIALGGNALQANDEAPTYDNQRKNVNIATESIVYLQMIKKKLQEKH